MSHRTKARNKKKTYRKSTYKKHLAKPKDYLKVYCDGSYNVRKVKDLGSWGALLEQYGISQCFYGVFQCDTSNHAELKACISAVLLIKDRTQKIIVYSDSKYVVDGINDYLEGWKKNNWFTRKGNTIENKEDWQVMDDLKKQFYDISFRHVKGHYKCEGNIRADQIARECLLKYIQEGGVKR